MLKLFYCWFCLGLPVTPVLWGPQLLTCFRLKKSSGGTSGSRTCRWLRSTTSRPIEGNSPTDWRWTSWETRWDWWVLYQQSPWRHRTLTETWRRLSFRAWRKRRTGCQQMKYEFYDDQIFAWLKVDSTSSSCSPPRCLQMLQQLFDVSDSPADPGGFVWADGRIRQPVKTTCMIWYSNKRGQSVTLEMLKFLNLNCSWWRRCFRRWIRPTGWRKIM